MISILNLSIATLLLVGLSSSAEVATRIIGGTKTTAGEFPWMVSLQKLNDSTGAYRHFCAGSIVSTTQIVTAAHCVWSINSTNIASFRIVAGAWNISAVEDSQQTSNFAQVDSNPGYTAQGAAGGNDMAVITLETPLTFNAQVGPIALDSTTINARDKCVSSGWGNQFFSTAIYYNPSDVLLKKSTRVISDLACKLEYSPIIALSGFVQLNNTVCSKPLLGGGTCQGDSGGPLVCYKSNQPYIVGVVSWGFQYCGLPIIFPDVHGSIAKMRSFLDSFITSQ